MYNYAASMPAWRSDCSKSHFTFNSLGVPNNVDVGI